MIKYLTKFITKSITKQHFVQSVSLTIHQRYYFNQANQALEELKNRIETLFDKFYKESNLDNKYKMMQDIMNIKQQINKQYFGNQTDQYIGHRRDQLVLAQIQLQKNNLEECKSIIQQIMQTDFENEMKEHQDENQAFLAELYILKCMSNLQNLLQAQEDAIKALNYLEYFVENKCPIFKAVLKDNTKPDENAQLDSELQYIQNMVQHLQLLAKIKQESGQYEDALHYLAMKSSLLDNQGQIFKKLFAKELKVQQELKDQDLQRYFMGLLVQQAITIKIMARVCIRLSRLDDAKQMVETALNYFEFLIENRVIDRSDDNYIDCLCEQYQVILDTSNNEVELNKIKHKLEMIFETIENDENNLYSRFIYESFKVTYLKEDPQKLKLIMNDLKDDVPSVLEYNNIMLNYYIQNKNEQYDEAIKISDIQLEDINKYFDCSHYLFITTIMYSIQISILTGKLEKAKQYLQIAKDAEKQYNLGIDFNIKLYEARITFDELKQQKNSFQQIEKLTSDLESLAPVSFSFAFGKANLLKYMYQELHKLKNDNKYKELEKAKQNECQAILKQHPEMKSQIKNIVQQE